jgi:small-conductance mechanosensitive channel
MGRARISETCYGLAGRKERPDMRGIGDGLARFWRLVAAVAPILLAVWVLLAPLAQTASAQSNPFSDFGLGVERSAETSVERDRPPDLQAYGEIAESYRSSSALEATERRLTRFRDRLVETLSRAPHVLSDIRAALASSAPNGDPTYFIGLLAFLAFLIGIGRAAATLFAVYVARPIFVGMQKPDPSGMAEKLPVLATRVGLAIMGVLVTVLTAMLVGSGFFPENERAAVVTAIVVFGAFAAHRVLDTILRMTLAPYLRAYRLPVLTDREARRLYRWIAGIVLFRIASHGALIWLDQLGLQAQTSALLHLTATAGEVGLVFAGAAVNRHAIRGAVLGGRRARDASWLAQGGAALWGPSLVLYMLAAWAVRARTLILGTDAAPPPPILALLLALLAGLLVYVGIAFAVDVIARRRGAARAPRDAGDEPAEPDDAPAEDAAVILRDARADGGDAEGDDEGGAPVSFARAAPQAPPPGTMRSFADLALRVASLLAIGTGLYTLAATSAARFLLESESALDRAGDVLDILILGYVIYHAIRIWIDQRIEEEGGEEIEAEPGDEGGGASAASRLATLLPLVRNFVLVLVIASTAVFVAMEVGVNVAPLLGGAGIVGLAIGFGAQTLVRDILSGAFFLIDDAFRKGEYIDIGDVKGTVEKISLRSFQLRHHLGALNTVPFGEVRFLTNFSRDWVMMKLPLRLTYDTDPEKVRKLIKKLGQQLLDHPTEGHKFLQPLKSQGVYMMEDSAMIIRVKYMTRPGDQWTTRKLVYSSIRELFEREGIRFAHKEVTVRIPELEDRSAQGLSDAEMKAVGAAARRAVDDDVERQGPRPVAVGDDR